MNPRHLVARAAALLASCSIALACGDSGVKTTSSTSRAASASTSTSEAVAIIGTTQDLGCRYVSADEVSRATGLRVTAALPGGNPSTQLFADLPPAALATCQWQTDPLAGWCCGGLQIDTSVRQFPDAASAKEFTRRSGVAAGPALGDTSSKLSFFHVFVATGVISFEIQVGNGPQNDATVFERLSNQAITALAPVMLARINGTMPLAPPPAGESQAPPSTVTITDQQVADWKRAYAGTWSGSWKDDTFGTSGKVHLTLDFDSTAKSATADLRIEGKILGGQSSIDELKRTEPLSSVVGALKLDDPAAKLAWRFTGNSGGITIIASNLAGHPDVTLMQLTARFSDQTLSRVAGTFVTTFTNNKTATGSWQATKA